jgi:hypothetical protein
MGFNFNPNCEIHHQSLLWPSKNSIQPIAVLMGGPDQTMPMRKGCEQSKNVTQLPKMLSSHTSCHSSDWHRCSLLSSGMDSRRRYGRQYWRATSIHINSEQQFEYNGSWEARRHLTFSAYRRQRCTGLKMDRLNGSLYRRQPGIRMVSRSDFSPISNTCLPSRNHSVCLACEFECMIQPCTKFPALASIFTVIVYRFYPRHSLLAELGRAQISK